MGPVLDLALRSTPVGETAALLDAVDAASRDARGAQRCIVVRLTDGRVKVIQVVGQDAASLVSGLSRRYGPLSAAYFVEPSPGPRGGTRVSDLIRKRRWLRSPLGWTADESNDQPRAAGLSRNAAIFAASLGMSTGALPKVETILTSPGVFS